VSRMLKSTSIRSASTLLRRRSCQRASYMSSRLSSIIRLIASSCSIRHAAGRVLPALKYARCPETRLEKSVMVEVCSATVTLLERFALHDVAEGAAYMGEATPVRCGSPRVNFVERLPFTHL